MNQILILTTVLNYRNLVFAYNNISTSLKCIIDVLLSNFILHN